LVEDEITGEFKALIAQPEWLEEMQHRQLQGMIPDFNIQTADWKNGIPGKIRLGEAEGNPQREDALPAEGGAGSTNPIPRCEPTRLTSGRGVLAEGE
jgi:hypothetical protein